MGEGTWPRHLQTRAVGSGGLEWASWQSGAAVPSLGQRAGGSAVCRLTHPQSPWGKALELAVPGHRSLSLWGLAERWQQGDACLGKLRQPAAPVPCLLLRWAGDKGQCRAGALQEGLCRGSPSSWMVATPAPYRPASNQQ